MLSFLLREFNIFVACPFKSGFVQRTFILYCTTPLPKMFYRRHTNFHLAGSVHADVNLLVVPRKK
jgi:hypothetical protein